MSPDPYRPPPASGRPPRPPAPDAAPREAGAAPPADGAPPAGAPPGGRRDVAQPSRLEEPPRYTRYRAGWRPFDRSRGSGREKPSPATRLPRVWLPSSGRQAGDWRGRVTPGRVLLAVVLAVVAWLALSMVLFLISAGFEQSHPSGNVKAVLDGGSFPLVSATNVLVLGSDQRTKKTHEPGASTSGPSRSDVIMLIRTGAGHSARLSIPRDTVVDIPGHGLQKINAAYAFGGPALTIRVVKSYLGIPINHLVEVNFDNFPQLIDAMGGVNLKTGCVISLINGGVANGGYTLRLKAGNHHLSGQQALALARTRHNACRPSESDLTRAERQQRLFQAMKSKLVSPLSFFRLPWVSWDAPQAIRSDMSGPTLLGLFGALATSGSPSTRLLRPSGYVNVPSGGVGLQVSDSERRAEVARFMKG